MPETARSPIGAVPVPLAVMIVFTKNVKILEVQRQMRVGFPGLDMIHINSYPMLGRSSAGHAPAAVILLCPVLELGHS